MLSSFRVSKPFGQSKINYINVMLFFSNADQKVVGFDITMKEMPRVDKLDSLEHLVRQHEDSFKTELSLAVVEQVLKRWA